MKGLISLESKKKEEVSLEKEIEVEEDLSAEVEKIEINTEDFLKKIKNYKKNHSHIEKTHVTSDKAILSLKNKMDMKEIIEQLKETIEASSADKFSTCNLQFFILTSALRNTIQRPHPNHDPEPQCNVQCSAEL